MEWQCLELADSVEKLLPRVEAKIRRLYSLSRSRDSRGRCLSTIFALGCCASVLGQIGVESSNECSRAGKLLKFKIGVFQQNRPDSGRGWLDANSWSLNDFTLRAGARSFRCSLNVSSDGDSRVVAALVQEPNGRYPLGAARALHGIEFDLDEAAPIRRLDADGLVAPIRYPSPVHERRLLLGDELVKDDVVIFAPVRSQALSYGADTGPRIRLQFPDTPLLGVWSKPGAPFICIEPWHGIADPAGFSADFTEKPGIFIVPPHAYRELKMQVTWASG